ncbi:MAG TPA: esterase, partial [Mucilaginibacter sp.]
MKKNIIIFFLATIICGGINAQQNVGYKQGNIVSPQINDDHTITLRLNAPLAQSVTVKGDWEADGGVGQMTKDNNGVWSFTTASLPSDMYLYTFKVDNV